jgi:hypothetical protein
MDKLAIAGPFRDALPKKLARIASAPSFVGACASMMGVSIAPGLIALNFPIGNFIGSKRADLTRISRSVNR